MIVETVGMTNNCRKEQREESSGNTLKSTSFNSRTRRLVSKKELPRKEEKTRVWCHRSGLRRECSLVPNATKKSSRKKKKKKDNL